MDSLSKWNPSPLLSESETMFESYRDIYLCMYVFPFRLKANTANTHHQALGECRAKGSGELKVEAKQPSSLMLFTEEKRFVSIICTMLVSTLIGPINAFISLRTNSSRSERLFLLLHSMSHPLHDSNSLSRQLLDWVERSFLHLPRGD